MKLKLLLLGLAAAANVFVAIRFRQPMAFVVAGAIVAVMIYCYLTGAKRINPNDTEVNMRSMERMWC